MMSFLRNSRRENEKIKKTWADEETEDMFLTDEPPRDEAGGVLDTAAHGSKRPEVVALDTC